VKEITDKGVILQDGEMVEGNVAVWATGADPHEDLTNESQLHLLKGYYRVNSFLQSTSHPNVFAGGDCNTIEEY
jgi:NADH dehydrogenase FAD-containing subunit